MTAITTTGLTKRYGGVTALDRVDLEVEAGEIYGLLGPNGAGKSTTIAILMDYSRPTDGTATVLGYDTREDALAVHQHVGILPDRFGLYDRLTGRRHVQYIIDSKDAGDTALSLLERVGLSDAADRKAGGYSRGMQQRLALAMSLVGQPEVLILDEPFSGLDPHGVRLVREIVHEENARGATVFFSSHVLKQVELVCDRVGILSNGSLLAEGTANELRDEAGVKPNILVRVNRCSETVMENVRAVEGVLDVTKKGRQITVTTDTPDRREPIIDAIERTDVNIVDSTIHEPTVEDVFVAYTTDSQVG